MKAGSREMFVVFLIMFSATLAYAQHDAAECGFPETSKDGPALSPAQWIEFNQRKAQIATELLRQPTRAREKEEWCTYVALREFTEAKGVTKNVTDADIELAAEYLLFNHSDGMIAGGHIGYTAVDLFFMLGPKSAPKLVEVIGNHESDSLWTRNAIQALFLALDRTDLSKMLHTLQEAINAEQDNGRLFNLRGALEQAKKRSCWIIVRSKPEEPLCVGVPRAPRRWDQ